MARRWVGKNVYDAFLERMEYLFGEFDNIFVSFSGGKDSSLLLNLTLDFARTYYPEKRIGLFHQDFEAQYQYTTDYVRDTFERLKDETEAYWVCLPMATRTAVGNYEMYWYPWDDRKKEIWVRPMPEGDYVISLDNNPITTYEYRMHQEDLAKAFGQWYAERHEGKTVCLLGIRAEESAYRYMGFSKLGRGTDEPCYVSGQRGGFWTASPLYDWTVKDIWLANAKFGYPYNPLYDLYYKAGVRPEQMRVASPFNEYALESLHLYRVIEPQTWAKLVGRVRGANFASVYARTKAMGARKLTLPEGYTWEEYTKFLLSTLPPSIRSGYVRRFVASMDFWHHTGGGLSEEVIAELEEKGYRIARNGVSNYTAKRYAKVIFLDKIPDHTDDIRSTRDIPSWKRMCLCILKNDHLCRGMGFGLTREQQRAVDEIREKYDFWEQRDKR